MSNAGSIWRKWNFHVHTKGTTKNDQFKSSTMEEFFGIFFRKAFETQTSAIGITDYFSIERYFDTLTYQQSIDEKVGPDGSKLFNEEEATFIKGIFLFPNVELRMLPSTGSGKLINIHFLFNPDYVDKLEHDFFSKVTNEKGKSMTREGIIRYGAYLSPGLEGNEAKYRNGIDNFATDLKSLVNLLNDNKELRENSIIVVSNSNKDGASGLQDHYSLFENEEGALVGFRGSIYKISQAVFSANIKDIKYFIGKRLEGTEGYNEEIYNREVQSVVRERGSLKPCIIGCDSHSEEGLFSKSTWIKSDLNFEGLRQICFEPEQRVRIQDEMPDFKEGKLVIDRVKFISPSGAFTENPIRLNSNLNVIIGGKSSGKSILLYSIARTLSSDQSVLKNDNDKFKYELERIDSDFDFEIVTKGGFSQRLKRDVFENSILPEIKYIPQNYLVKLAEPELNKKGKSLNKLVRDLITEESESLERYNNFIVKVQQLDKLRNSKIDGFFESITQLNVIDSELRTKSNREVLLRNISENERRVEELSKNSGLDADQIESYKMLQAMWEENDRKRQRFNADFSVVQLFNNDLVRVSTELLQRKNALLQSLQSPELHSYYGNVYRSLDVLNEEALKMKEETTLEVKMDGIQYFNAHSKFNEILSSINEERAELQEATRPYLKNDDIKNQIETINLSIADDKRMLEEIGNLTSRSTHTRMLIEQTKQEIYDLYKASYMEYASVIGELHRRTADLEKDGLSIQGKAQFNFPKFRNAIVPLSDGRTGSYRDFPILQEGRNATDPSDFDSILEELKLIFDSFLHGEYSFNRSANLVDATKKLFDDYFFDYWEITYKRDKLGEMSTGKASFIILMLIIGLSRSRAPILIDQPEDNLDNRSITTDLVNYLRKKKLERQIIVVTHNANIVVNADAENIIVANQKGQNNDNSTSPYKFDYINGALEDSFEKQLEETDILKSMGIRQHVADIVEGGKEAFIKREQKYRFH